MKQQAGASIKGAAMKNSKQYSTCDGKQRGLLTSNTKALHQNKTTGKCDFVTNPQNEIFETMF